MKLFLDPGHGGSDSGASANGLLEKNLNLSISLKIRDKLMAYEGIEVRMSRSTDTFLSLQQRTDDANKWGADYLLSIHINAGGGVGYEDFIHDKLSDSSETAQIRNVIHAEIIQEVDFYNRGKKKANFHLVRESNMPAMLTENGFIDNKKDAEKLKSDAFLDQIAQGHVNGLVKAFGLKKKPNTVTIYTIQTGGLSPSRLKKFSEFLHQNNIGWTAVTRHGESARVKIEGLTPSQKTIVSNFLNGESWYYGLFK